MGDRSWIRDFHVVLVGWTVRGVKTPTFDEGLCELTLERNTKKGREVCSVGLSATDLGAWVAWVRDEQGLYQTFQQLADTASEYHLVSDGYLNGNTEDEPFRFRREDDIFAVMVKDGTEWRIRVANIEEKWSWVLDPTSDNDPTSWFMGFPLKRSACGSTTHHDT